LARLFDVVIEQKSIAPRQYRSPLLLVRMRQHFLLQRHVDQKAALVPDQGRDLVQFCS
jgi:hypothetical protein